MARNAPFYDINDLQGDEAGDLTYNIKVKGEFDVTYDPETSTLGNAIREQIRDAIDNGEIVFQSKQVK